MGVYEINIKENWQGAYKEVNASPGVRQLPNTKLALILLKRISIV